MFLVFCVTVAANEKLKYVIGAFPKAQNACSIRLLRFAPGDSISLCGEGLLRKYHHGMNFYYVLSQACVKATMGLFGENGTAIMREKFL